MSVCLDHAPLFCLVGAVLAFSAGLVGWTIAASLALPVKICAATMTCTTFLILFTIIIWETREWWHQRNKKATETSVDTESTPEMEALHSRWQKWKSGGKAGEEKHGHILHVYWDMPASFFGKWQPVISTLTRHFHHDILPFHHPHDSHHEPSQTDPSVLDLFHTHTADGCDMSGLKPAKVLCSATASRSVN